MLRKATVAFIGALAAVQGAAAQAGNPGASAVPESQTPEPQGVAKATTAVERASWCGNNKPDSKLPCDVVAQLDTAAIVAAGLNVGNETDRRSREKLVPYYHARLETLEQFKQNEECCRKCKVENQLLTAEQDKYWKKVADDLDDWITDMAKFERKETDVSPDTAWEHSMKVQTGQPGSAIETSTAPQVPVEQYCQALAQGRPAPATNTTQGGQGPTTPIVLPQIPICYMVQVEASVSANLNGAKFRMNVTSNAETKMAQEVCRACYHVSTLVDGKIESHSVIGQAVLVAAREPIPIKAEQVQFVPADCGCDRKATPIAPQEFSEQIFRTEALAQLQRMDFNVKSSADAGISVMGHSIFIAQTFTTTQQGPVPPAVVTGGNEANSVPGPTTGRPGPGQAMTGPSGTGTGRVGGVSSGGGGQPCLECSRPPVVTEPEVDAC